jgi:hypothetical protein
VAGQRRSGQPPAGAGRARSGEGLGVTGARFGGSAGAGRGPVRGGADGQAWSWRSPRLPSMAPARLGPGQARGEQGGAPLWAAGELASDHKGPTARLGTRAGLGRSEPQGTARNGPAVRWCVRQPVDARGEEEG